MFNLAASTRHAEGANAERVLGAEAASSVARMRTPGRNTRKPPGSFASTLSTLYDVDRAKRPCECVELHPNATPTIGTSSSRRRRGIVKLTKADAQRSNRRPVDGASAR